MAGNGSCLSPQPGEWMKGKVVGSGSFGTVHLAMNKSNGALFVVKSAESQAGHVALENEADILESLNSQHVVKCIGKDLSNRVNGERKLNLFIEYMAGGSLADVADKFGGILDEKVIRLYTKEILHGLNYLHKNGVVHCDLKCMNVLLGSFGNIKLADFGCAKRLNDSKTCKNLQGFCRSICGTPLWMAPEVLRNEELNLAADIWSLGCTIIEMATGRPPWAETEISNPMAAVLMIACGNLSPRFPRQFSKEGLDFLEKCLERNPKNRWTSEELLDHPFVSGKSLEERKEEVCSPSGVLDGGIYEEDDYGSDDSPLGSEIISRVPFSIRSSGQKDRFSSRDGTKCQLASSGNWVNVRTG